MVKKKLSCLSLNKKLVVIIIVCFFSCKLCLSQTNIKGVITSDKKEFIPFVTITVKKDSISPVINYSYSDEKGNYKIKVKKEDVYYLSFSCLGYVSKSTNIHVKNIDLELNKNITLQEKPFSLNEVIVTANKPIRVKKDTVVFNANFFKTGNEKNVEDLLKKIPGVTVDANGTIKVGNQEIDKLMVDGDDFFDKGYKVLSKNMPSHPIDKVEVLNKYSNNKLLKGIAKSDKIALNLKLKDDFKRVWFGSSNLSYGVISENKYEFKFNLANFGKKNKYFFITNFNNIGFDALGDIENLIRPFRDSNEPSSIGDNQKAENVLSLNANILNFKKSRTNFNNAELVSINVIFNPTNKLKLKTLAFFNSDENKFFKKENNIFGVKGSNFVNVKKFSSNTTKQVAFGSLHALYDISIDETLETVTKYSKGNFDNSSNLTFNGSLIQERLPQNNVLVDQKITYTNRLKNKKAVIVTGRAIKDKKGQDYKVNQFYFQNLFPLFSSSDGVFQESTNQMNFAGLNIHFFDKTKNDNLIELQLGNEFRHDILHTLFSLLNKNKVLAQPKKYMNKLTYKVNDLYFKSKYNIKKNKLLIMSRLDFHQLFNQIKNDKDLLHQNPFFINPSFSLDWEINKNNKLQSSYSYNTTNAKVLDVFNGFTMVSFRSFLKGTGTFNQLDSSRGIINYQLGNWTDRFFANMFIVYTKNHDFFSTNTQLDQRYNQSNKILIKDRKSLSVNSKIDYYMKPLASNIRLGLGGAKTSYKNIVNNSSLRNVCTKTFNYGIELRSGFKGFFNYHLGSKWMDTSISIDEESAFTNNLSFLDVSFVFNKRFNFQLQSERYCFGALEKDNTYYFLDFDIGYKILNSKMNIGLTGKNIFNTTKFKSYLINDLGSSTIEYRLLPRFILLKGTYRF